MRDSDATPLIVITIVDVLNVVGVGTGTGLRPPLVGISPNSQLRCSWGQR